MSSPKRPDECHSFSIHVACMVGDRKAILLKEIYGWCHKNLSNNRNIHFGLAWTYNSAKAYKEKFPYWPEKSIARWLKELQNDGWIYATDKFNKFSMDRTRWYTIHFERYDAAVNSQFLPKSQNDIWVSRIDICISQNDTPISQNEISESPKMRNDISQNETTIPSSTISYSSTTTSKEHFAPKVASPSSEKTFEELAAKAKKITATQSDVMPDGDEELTQLKIEKPKRKKVAAKKESQPEQKEPSLFTLAKDNFTEWHKKHSPGVEMYWDRKEIGQLAQMIKRLQHEAKASNFVARSDQDFIEKIFDPFCKKYINSKEWFSDSFTPASIVSKWNVIVQALRNPKAKNGTKTPERLKMDREYQPSSEIKVSKVPV